MRLNLLRTMVVLTGLSGCAAPSSGPIVYDPPRPDLAWVVSHGWHTDLAIPVSALDGPLVRFRSIYPGATTLIFGFGDRIYAMSRDRDVGTFAAALLPMRGAIMVTALAATPEAAYGAANVLRLPLPAGGDAALSHHLWAALGKDAAGRPRLLGRGPYAGSLVYAAADRYSLIYTCNSWTMDAVEATGLPIGPGEALFAGQVRERIAPFAAGPVSSASSGRAGSSRPDR